VSVVFLKSSDCTKVWWSRRELNPGLVGLSTSFLRAYPFFVVSTVHKGKSNLVYLLGLLCYLPLTYRSPPFSELRPIAVPVLLIGVHKLGGQNAMRSGGRLGRDTREACAGPKGALADNAAFGCI